jgi:cytochrome P450
MDCIDKYNWTETFNLVDYFSRFTVDSSTEFFFGTSTNLQNHFTSQQCSTGKINTEFKLDRLQDTLKLGQKLIGTRIKLGSFYWMYDGYSYRKAVRYSTSVINGFLEGCIGRAKSRSAENDDRPSNLLETMVAAGYSLNQITNECRHLIVAGFDTTTNCLAILLAIVERHPYVFNILQDEILSEFGTEKAPRQPITFASLERCTYLQWVLCETLRLYPIIPITQRVATKDTVLPRGGGHDGQSPIAVPKGTSVQIGIYVCHQRKDLWGEDATQFRPERWEGRKKDYSFLPFLAGPHICLGRKCYPEHRCPRYEVG